ncbi:Translation initiation factor IF3-1, mitochondrial [Linum grandiflorum]
MAYWCRLAQSQLKHISHQCPRRCFHTSYASSVLYTANNSTAFAWRDRLSGTTVKPDEFFFARSYSQGWGRKEEDNSGEPRLNGKITGQIVRLVTDSDHKVVSLRDALEQAKRMNLDLVEVQRNADPPVCKIMDYHKEKYVREQTVKDRAKSKSDVTLRKGPCKEVRFTKKIELKDLKMKADSVKRLMERGYRVKCVALPSSRKLDAAPEDLGSVLSTIMDLLEDVAVVESGPLLEKKQAYAIVRHIKFGPSKKGAKKVKEPTGSSGVSEESPAEDGVLSDEDDGLNEIAVHPAAGRAPYNSASNVPKYSDPRQRHGSEAAVRIPPSMPEPPPPSENRYKKPGPANNHFRPPFTDNRRPQEGGSFRPERQFPNDRNQQQRSGLNIPPPTGVRRQDPSAPSNPATKAPNFGIFSSPKPGGPSEDDNNNNNNNNNNSNVVNRYAAARRF